MSNTAAPEFREVKARQGGEHIRSADLFRLDQRTIIITGGAGYLGVEAAGCILESGGDVICLDVVESPRSEGDVDQLTELANTHGQLLSYHRLDVTDPHAISKTFETFVPGLRYPIRGLVGCAGVSDNDPAHEFSVERFRRLMEINVTGTFSLAQAVALEMKKANVDGSMVLTASMSGSVANKGVDTAGYNASKSGVHQLARSLAAEWGSRKGMPLIRVNTLSPGYIRTPATTEALQKPGMEAQWTGDNMLYRLSLVDEFRGPILFLLSDASSFMTGADLRVDGGHCAW